MMPRGTSCGLFLFGLVAVSASLLAGESAAPQKSAGQLFSQLDTNHDGRLTAEEIPLERRKSFEHLVRVADRDENGELNLAEFRQGLRPESTAEAAEETPAESSDETAPAKDLHSGRQELWPLFRRFDRNQDRQVSRDEWSVLAKSFDDIDADKNGELDARELNRWLFRIEERANPEKRPVDRSRAGSPPATEPATAAARSEKSTPARGRLDVDQNGKLSREEAPERLRKNFDRFDLDHDGYLNRQEMRKALQELGEKPRKKLANGPSA